MDGQLALLENVCLFPQMSPVDMPGQMEGFTHQASMLVMGVEAGGSREMIEGCLARLSEGAGPSSVSPGPQVVIYGVSEGPARSLIVRILGHKAEPLYHVLQEIAGILMAVKPVVYAS